MSFALPNLIVIGAMKCGTSSLHHYLSLHPDITMSEQKELNYFAEEHAWKRGLAWYESNFPAGTPIRGESSPNYTKYPAFKGVPERLHETLPDAKLVYLIRDPIDRLVSHYIDAYSFGRENRLFMEAMADLRDNHYVNCSKYFMQLSRYLDLYPLERIAILTSEDLKQRRVETLSGVFRFAGVDGLFSTPEFEDIVYPSAAMTRKPQAVYALTRVADRVGKSRVRRYLPPGLRTPVTALARRTGRSVPRPEVDQDLRARLTDELKPDIDELRRLTGRDFAAWSV